MPLRTPHSAVRPVPLHLLGTRAALFYLWGGRLKPAETSRAEGPSRPVIAAAQHLRTMSGLHEDTFLFH